MSELYQQLFA